MTATTLADELLLLVYDDERGTPVGGHFLDYGVVAAVLVELALAGRLTVEGGRLVVADAGPTDSPVLDGVLAQLAAADKPRRAQDWVPALAHDLQRRILDGLVERGVLRRDKGRVLLVFPRTNYPAAHGVQPPAEVAARERLRAAVAGSAPVDPRTAALCDLVALVGVEQQVFADLDRSTVKARLTEIGRGGWAVAAVRQVMDDVAAAVTVSTATTVIITSAS